MSEELTKEQMKAVIKRQLFDWQMSRYDLEVQLRVQKRIGGEAESIKSITDRLALCEKALDALQEELAALATQPPQVEDNDDNQPRASG